MQARERSAGVASTSGTACPYRSRRPSNTHRGSLPAASNSHALRFREFKPIPLNQWQQDEVLAVPSAECVDGLPTPRVQAVVDAPDGWKPQRLWDAAPRPGSLQPGNPYAQRFRIKQLHLPAPFSLPGSDHWSVEVLNDYTREMPSLRVTDDYVQLRLGFLGRARDPIPPFFWYRGVEHVRYTWGDRALQALYLSLYAAVHVAVFKALSTLSVGFAAAFALNWARQRLSLPKVALLALLAASGRVWLYWVWLAARLMDEGLKRLAPPVRKFFWANFTVWMLYLVFTPSHYYPVPLWPFTPGSFGASEAV